MPGDSNGRVEEPSSLMALSTQELSLQQEEEEEEETEEKMAESLHSDISGPSVKPSVALAPGDICVIDLTDSPPTSPVSPNNTLDMASLVTDGIAPVATPDILTPPPLPPINELVGDTLSSESKPILPVSATQSVAVPFDQPLPNRKRGRPPKCLNIPDSTGKESEDTPKPKRRRRHQNEEPAKSLGTTTIAQVTTTVAQAATTAASTSGAGTVPLMSSFTLSSLRSSLLTSRPSRSSSVPPTASLTASSSRSSVTSQPSQSSAPNNEGTKWVGNSQNITYRLMVNHPMLLAAGASNYYAPTVPIFQLPTHSTSSTASFPSMQHSATLGYGAEVPYPLVNVGAPSSAVQPLHHFLPLPRQGTGGPSLPSGSITGKHLPHFLRVPVLATKISSSVPSQELVGRKPSEEILGQVNNGSTVEMAENVDKLEKLLHSKKTPSPVLVAHQENSTTSQAPTPLAPAPVQEQTAPAKTDLDHLPLPAVAACSDEGINLESRQLVKKDEHEKMGERNKEEEKEGEEEGELGKAEEAQDKMPVCNTEDEGEEGIKKAGGAEDKMEKEGEEKGEKVEIAMEIEEDEYSHCEDERKEEKMDDDKVDEEEKDEEELKQEEREGELLELSHPDQQNSVVEEREESLSSQHLSPSNREVNAKDVTTTDDFASPTHVSSRQEETDVECASRAVSTYELTGDSDNVVDIECQTPAEPVEPGSPDNEQDPDLLLDMETNEDVNCPQDQQGIPKGEDTCDPRMEEGAFDSEDPLPVVPGTPTQHANGCTAPTTSSPLVTPVSILKHISRYDSPTSTNKVSTASILSILCVFLLGLSP